MDQVDIEYVGGPLDGSRGQAPVGRTGLPPLLRTVVTPAVWRSALDDAPAVPEEWHRYERDPDTPPPTAGTAQVWRYQHRGKF